MSQSCNNNIQAIFSYGTLRADRTIDGDDWGVMSQLKSKGWDCIWYYGTLSGYSLYQDKSLFYPFATPNSSGIVKGTVLTWASKDAFDIALPHCDSIEGYTEDNSGLYKRTVVDVYTKERGIIKAYFYYQEMPVDYSPHRYLAFPDGDWVKK